MQIFSKLQRNSFNYIFIKGILFFLLALFNSWFVFFPLFLGLVICCENVFFAVFYFSFFALLHHLAFFKVIYFFTVIIFYDFYLREKIRDYINATYRSVVGVVFIYTASLPLFGVDNFILIYILYNMAMDILISRFFRCAQT